MNNAAKNKLLVWLVALLLLANAGTLLFFWLGNRKQGLPPKGEPKEFLIKELGLDASQQQQFDKLVAEHRQAVNALREQVKEKKDALFELIKNTTATDSVKQAAASAVSAVTEQIDMLTVNHFQKVRALCTPEQQKRFDAIIHDITKMMAQPRPPMGPGNGPPPGDNRPPPPGE